MPTPRHHNPSTRGLTLLEVVLAVVMLGMVATSVMSAVAFVLGTEGRSRKILAATEVANRLILTHLDDKKNMPSRAAPIDYGPYRFTYDVDISTVSMELSSAARDNASRTNTSGGNASATSLSRFKLVTVNVYVGEERSVGGVDKGEQLASLSRIFDPTAVRNADVMSRFNDDPTRLSELIGEITGTSTGGSGSGDSGNTATRGLGRSRDSSRGTNRNSPRSRSEDSDR